MGKIHPPGASRSGLDFPGNVPRICLDAQNADHRYVPEPPEPFTWTSEKPSSPARPCKNTQQGTDSRRMHRPRPRVRIQAPNHKLTNPWRFTRVGPKPERKSWRWVYELKAQKAAKQGRELTESYVAKLRAKLGPLAGRAYRQPGPGRRRRFARKEDYASVACAIRIYQPFAVERGSRIEVGDRRCHASCRDLRDRRH